jgi:hypothetical protein
MRSRSSHIDWFGERCVLTVNLECWDGLCLEDVDNGNTLLLAAAA